MHKKKHNQGFTLVEVIVVLVLLSIGSSVAIPAMTGWIDNSNEKSAIVEAQTCLIALRTIAVERDSVGEKYELGSDEKETLTLAKSPSGADIVDAVVGPGASVERMEYKTADGVFVTYANGKFTVSESAYSFGQAQDMAAIMETMDANKPGGGSMDSGANGLTGSGSTKTVAALKELGIDLTTMGATAWGYRTSGPFFFWTTVDISKKNAGDIVPVMRYNQKSGTFTVWDAKLKEATFNGQTYTTIGDSLVGSVKNDLPKEQQTYDNMMETYAKELEKYDKKNAGK